MEDNLGLEKFRPGIYRHFKGPIYEADHLMRDANDDARIGVHYIGLNVSSAKEGPRHMIRTWEDWNAKVHKDGSVCHSFKEGKCINTQVPVTPRFDYLGPFYKRNMSHED